MSVAHLVPSAHGMIRREWWALNSGSYSLVIEEEGNGLSWLLIYDWDGGWEMIGSFRMRMALEYEGELMPRVGRIVDVGESNNPGSNEVVVVEEVEMGFLLLIYDWSYFWEIWNFQVSYYIYDGRYVYSNSIGESGSESEESISDVEQDMGSNDGWDEDTPSLNDLDYLDL
jgi:hypothetical protein